MSNHKETISTLWQLEESELERQIGVAFGLSNWEVERRVGAELKEEMLREGKLILDEVGNLHGPEYARRRLQRLTASAVDALYRCRDSVYQAVCVTGDYCNRRRKGEFQSEGWGLAVVIADFLVSQAVNLPLPITHASVYLVKKGILDAWCKCDKGSH